MEDVQQLDSGELCQVALSAYMLPRTGYDHYAFESLRIWHDSRRLVRRIYDLTSVGAFDRDFGLKDQLRRSGISAMSNIAKGYERGGRKELLRFLAIAKGSIAEVRSQLYVAEDVGYIGLDQALELRAAALALSRRITSFAREVRSRAERDKS